MCVSEGVQDRSRVRRTQFWFPYFATNSVSRSLSRTVHAISGRATGDAIAERSDRGRVEREERRERRTRALSL